VIDVSPAVESTLSFADEPVAELRDRVVRALGYTFSWLKAVGAGNNVLEVAAGAAGPVEAAAWQIKIRSLQSSLRELLVMLPLSDTFATKDAKAAYERASGAFAEMYRQLVLSASTLPQPELLDSVADLGTALFQAPAAAITTVAEQASNAIARALGGTAGAIWSALWPWLLVAAVGGVVYVFRAPAARALGKVTA
jgi:hypothetical protein